MTVDLKKFKARASELEIKKLAVELNTTVLLDVLRQLMAYDTNVVAVANEPEAKQQGEDSIALSQSIINKDLAGASTREKSYNQQSKVRSGNLGHRHLKYSSVLQDSELTRKKEGANNTAEERGRKQVGMQVGKNSNLSAHVKSPLRFKVGRKRVGSPEVDLIERQLDMVLAEYNPGEQQQEASPEKDEFALPAIDERTRNVDNRTTGNAS